MQVILTDKVRNLGDIGDIVEVKPGYGRNFLIPQGKAQRATQASIAQFEEQRADLEKQAQDRLQQAQQRASQLAEVVVTISALAADEGKLYGSVGPREVSEALSEAGHAVEKREVIMPTGALHEVGEYEVDLQLHHDVMTTVKVHIIAAQQ